MDQARSDEQWGRLREELAATLEDARWRRLSSAPALAEALRNMDRLTSPHYRERAARRLRKVLDEYALTFGRHYTH